MNGTTNLIMGYCARLPFSHLEPFIASLRHTTFAGDVCLLIEDVAIAAKLAADPRLIVRARQASLMLVLRLHRKRELRGRLGGDVERHTHRLGAGASAYHPPLWTLYLSAFSLVGLKSWI